MAIIEKAGACGALVGVLLLSGIAHALSPADKCEASKLGTAGKYDLCRLKAEAKAAKTGGAPDFSKCDPKFSDKWTQAETTAGGMCPSNGDESAMQAFITEETDAIEAAVDGGTLPEGVLSCNVGLATCNGNLSTCNTNLAGCEAEPTGQRLKTGQTICWDASGTLILCNGTGQDGELQKGLARNYVDNGDGTVTDTKTGLMWEKLSNDGTVHDYFNYYNSTNAFSTKILNLNLVSFAGHSDWRLPNRNELESLVNVGNTNPAIDTAFNTACAPSCTVTTCSCTRSFYYWSSSTIAAVPSLGWVVDFNSGYVYADSKSNGNDVRAVRGGF